MALTLTERLRISLGNKAFRAYEITHDASTTAITAASLDLHYVEAAMIGGHDADGNTDHNLTTASGTSLAITALSASAKSLLWVIGY